MIKALNYLKNERHISNETIEKFHLGYVDPKGNIYVDCKAQLEHMQLKDWFNDSAMFPIYNLYNQPIGVSARSFNPQMPKYVNTVYEKTNHLYGFNHTWKDCLDANKVYVVEGNIDTCMMWQHGIRNVVGMLGSNLSLTQICLLMRFVDKIVLVPDGDNAGSKFLNRLVQAIPKEYTNTNLEFHVVNLPKGYDPDKFLQEFGRDKFLALESVLFSSIQDKLKRL